MYQKVEGRRGDRVRGVVSGAFVDLSGSPAGCVAVLSLEKQAAQGSNRISHNCTLIRFLGFPLAVISKRKSCMGFMDKSVNGKSHPIWILCCQSFLDLFGGSQNSP
ncbi:hypothetical protein KFK09_012559 [Dendrobium nobile]|uniref:Uncharacterized protein n=1 Tax=Dendrobium nobile TaxID=94219 RepID=A0A8T3BJC5_DENNO|nr:hypothetical protein KFK09_012559 [Dendrobium nobile]